MGKCPLCWEVAEWEDVVLEMEGVRGWLGCIGAGMRDVSPWRGSGQGPS